MPRDSGWLTVLAGECTRTSQVAVAKRLGLSGATINQVLKGKYKGNLPRIRSRVEGAYMAARVDCPVIGDIPRDQCITHQQRRRFAATNPLRVQLHKICPTCPNWQGGNS
jgi:hypothetical protein